MWKKHLEIENQVGEVSCQQAGGKDDHDDVDVVDGDDDDDGDACQESELG